MHCAASVKEEQCVEIVKTLLKEGADPNIQDIVRTLTAIHLALWHSYTLAGLVTLLLLLLHTSQVTSARALDLADVAQQLI